MMDADVIVIGGGPAGLAAATVIATDTRGRVIVVDESDRLGGRLPGQLYFSNGTWHIGAKSAEKLIMDALHAGVQLLPGHQVWSCEPGWNVKIVGSQTLKAPRIVVATGAVERPLPMPGWDLPGVLAVGAVQQLVQVQRVLPGRRVAVVGSDPLAMTAAEEIALGGGEVVGIFLPNGNAGQHAESSPERVLQAISNVASVAPAAWQRLGARALQSGVLASIVARFIPSRGISLGRARLRVRHRAEAILGTGRVEALRVRRVDSKGNPQGPAEDIEIDAVCLSGGLLPLQEITAANCELADVRDVGGIVPLHSPELRTTAPGLYVAGNVTGIEGARVAEYQGRLAGTTVAEDMGAYANGRTKIIEATQQLVTVRNEAALKFIPNIVQGREHLQALWAEHLREGQVDYATQ